MFVAEIKSPIQLSINYCTVVNIQARATYNVMVPYFSNWTLFLPKQKYKVQTEKKMMKKGLCSKFLDFDNESTNKKNIQCTSPI